MDESEALKIGMEVALRPLTEVAENAIGILGGDWLTETRIRNRSRLKQRTKEILEDRGISDTAEPSPSIILPLLSAAQDEGRSELLDLWAKLLAAAFDPSRQNRVRRAYMDVLAKFDPFDAILLERFRVSVPTGDAQNKALAEQFRVRENEIAVSAAHLHELGCLQPMGLNSIQLPTSYRISPFGSELLVALDT